MSTPSASSVPTPPGATSSMLDRWIPVGTCVDAWSSAYFVAWRFFPQGATGAALPINVIAGTTVLYGLLCMTLIGPVATAVIVRRLDVRSWRSGPRVLAVLVAIGVSVASVPALLHVAEQLLETLWSRWPQ
jgi:hypothetical protein